MASPTVMAPSTRAERPGRLAIAPISAAPSPGSALHLSPSSGASTPTSTCTPQLAIKPTANGPHSLPLASMASTPEPQSQPLKSSITSKEWVIPPRPKPGRKPATDTPPTKRKAQNRAAQRAFRERRAARVGELEEQLDDYRREHEQVEQDLQDRVNGLDLELHNLRSHCSMLEGMLEQERKDRERISTELEAARRQLRDERASISSRHASLPGLHAALTQHHTPRSSMTSTHSGHRNSTFAISQLISPPNPSEHGSSSDGKSHDAGCDRCDPNGPCACIEEVLAHAGPVVDCGKCSLGTRCECLEAALNPSTNIESDLKRRPSSISPLEPEEKRQRTNYDENEIDFTAMFSRKRTSVVVEPAAEPMPQPVAIPPRDSCGFCTEGTYCMCAEAAAAESQLPPIGSQVQTPPPDSDNDIGPTAMEFTSTGAVKLPRLSSLNRPNSTKASGKTGSCGPNGPGTCAQCLADPKAGLFCRSLAATMDKQSGSSKAGGGCCGGSAGGGCCKSKTSGPNVGLSVADAYKTLSSHRNFDRASDDIGSWLPKLRAVPRPQEVGESSTRRSNIEVETASIMSVLKGFDVRFGREP
ncbi:putative BZIP domain-containing protein [Seiridium unicorne]|uniref:BZIP domain-containing protein n=1 Tax=Seiridium unicorne TaxID=138068 RepID=A0ABR2VIB9_9PEZI